MSRTLALLALTAWIAQGLVACAPSISDVRIFHAKPPVPYRVLGMVNGNGPNEASAMQAVLQNAVEVGANGVIVQGQRQVGRQVLIHAEAISYQGPLPPAGAQPAAPQGASTMAPPPAPPQGY